MSSPKTLLITGATGKQGGAVIRALCASPFASTFKIIAVTRSKASKSAQSLASQPNISLVEGDLDNPNAIFEQTGPVWGVFSVQVASPGSDTEETRGKALVDASVIHGVSHFVYTSGDRGGPVRSPTNPTVVSNFIAKYNVEKHLEKEAAASAHGMTYTILRPVTFFENQVPGRHGQGFARMWEQLGTKKLQFVSIEDIGWFGAQALQYPDQYRNTAFSLAGDELTQPEAAVIFKSVVGVEMPIAPCLVGTALKFFMKEALGTMFQWFKEVGYGADVEECRRLHPEMQDYRTWLKENSEFVKR
jgi:nucleoside-diphosphate-sugar epimerase